MTGAPILGIWDGHDAGAALVYGQEILFAVNEERLTRKKLDIGFPKESIASALDYTGLKPQDIKQIAISIKCCLLKISVLVPAQVVPLGTFWILRMEHHLCVKLQIAGPPKC